jgi:hypothetical protein
MDELFQIRERYGGQLAPARLHLEPRLELLHLPLHQLVDLRLLVPMATVLYVQVGTVALGRPNVT